MYLWVVKIQKVHTIYADLQKSGLNPNEYFYLYSIILGLEPPKGINIGLAKAMLIDKGWIDHEDNPTIKFASDPIFEIAETKDFTENVEKYRSLWPKGVLPSGKPAKSSVKDLEQRFKWFFKNYDFDWEDILKSTEAYISSQAENGYRFMRTAAYFIYKQDTPQLRISTLADWCENSTEEQKNFGIDI